MQETVTAKSDVADTGDSSTFDAWSPPKPSVDGKDAAAFDSWQPPVATESAPDSSAFDAWQPTTNSVAAPDTSAFDQWQPPQEAKPQLHPSLLPHDGYKPVYKPGQTPVLPALGRAAAASAVPTAGAAAGGWAGAEGGAALGAMTGPAAPVAIPVLALIGGLAGAFLGGSAAGKAQDFGLHHILGNEKADELNQTLAKDRQEHPVGTFAGEVIPQLVAFKPSLKNLVAAKNFVKELTAAENAAALLRSPAGQQGVHNLVNVAFGAGTYAGTEAYRQYQEGDFNGIRLASSLVTGAVLTGGWRFGMKPAKLTPEATRAHLATLFPGSTVKDYDGGHVVTTAGGKSFRVEMGAKSIDPATASDAVLDNFITSAESKFADHVKEVRDQFGGDKRKIVAALQDAGIDQAGNTTDEAFQIRTTDGTVIRSRALVKLVDGRATKGVLTHEVQHALEMLSEVTPEERAALDAKLGVTGQSESARSEARAVAVERAVDSPLVRKVLGFARKALDPFFSQTERGVGREQVAAIQGRQAGERAAPEKAMSELPAFTEPIATTDTTPPPEASRTPVTADTITTGIIPDVGTSPAEFTENPLLIQRRKWAAEAKASGREALAKYHNRIAGQLEAKQRRAMSRAQKLQTAKKSLADLPDVGIESPKAEPSPLLAEPNAAPSIQTEAELRAKGATTQAASSTIDRLTFQQARGYARTAKYDNGQSVWDAANGKSGDALKAALREHRKWWLTATGGQERPPMSAEAKAKISAGIKAARLAQENAIWGEAQADTEKLLAKRLADGTLHPEGSQVSIAGDDSEWRVIAIHPEVLGMDSRAPRVTGKVEYVVSNGAEERIVNESDIHAATDSDVALQDAMDYFSGVSDEQATVPVNESGLPATGIEAPASGEGSTRGGAAGGSGNEPSAQARVEENPYTGERSFVGYDQSGFKLTGEEAVDHAAIAREKAAREQAKSDADARQSKLFAVTMDKALRDIERFRVKSANYMNSRSVRDSMAYTNDAGNNQAALYAHEKTGELANALKRFVGVAKDRIAMNDMTRKERMDFEAHGNALSFVIEAKGDRSQLDVMADKIRNSPLADEKWKKVALVAIDLARAKWDGLQQFKAYYKALTDHQFAQEAAKGLPTMLRDGYVMHAQDVDTSGDYFGLASAGEGSGQFSRPRTHDTFADSIAAGVDPKSLNALDLLQSRLTRGQRMLNSRAWLEAQKSAVDPKSGNAIVADMETQKRADGSTYQAAPDGYSPEEFAGQKVAVLRGYEGTFNALTDPTWWGKSDLRVLAQRANAAGKSVSLLVDTFHLGRIAFWQSMIKSLGLSTMEAPLPSWRRGKIMAETSLPELSRMIQRGEIPREWHPKLVEEKRVLDLAAKTGFNSAGISDALHQEWIRSIPLLGGVNRFIFDKFQRGAMNETYLLEFRRYKNMHDGRGLSDEAIARKVSKDLNTRFGNLGKQGLFKSATARDMMRMLILAPQWNEGLIRSELGAVGQTFDAAKDLLAGRKIVAGVLMRSVGGMIAAQFAANQLINHITRGHPTWENEEESIGAKLSAWVPDVIGGGPGFFLNPMSLAAETSHLLISKFEKNPDFWKVLKDYGRSRSSVVMRPILTMLTGEDSLGAHIRPDDMTAEIAKSAVPVPISGGAAFHAANQLLTGRKSEQFAGQFQKQALASVGLKTDQAPSEEQRMANLAKRFNKANGVVESGLFFTGDYQPIFQALRVGNVTDAAKEMELLLTKKGPADIMHRLNALPGEPFTRSAQREAAFYASLTPSQKEAYNAARISRQALAVKAMQLLQQVYSQRPEYQN